MNKNEFAENLVKEFSVKHPKLQRVCKETGRSTGNR